MFFVKDELASLQSWRGNKIWDSANELIVSQISTRRKQNSKKKKRTKESAHKKEMVSV
jgi:hypothetical protein